MAKAGVDLGGTVVWVKQSSRGVQPVDESCLPRCGGSCPERIKVLKRSSWVPMKSRNQEVVAGKRVCLFWVVERRVVGCH